MVESCSDCVGLGLRSSRWSYVGWMRCLKKYLGDGDGNHESNGIGGVMRLNLILTARG